MRPLARLTLFAAMPVICLVLPINTSSVHAQKIGIPNLGGAGKGISAPKMGGASSGGKNNAGNQPARLDGRSSAGTGNARSGQQLPRNTLVSNTRTGGTRNSVYTPNHLYGYPANTLQGSQVASTAGHTGTTHPGTTHPGNPVVATRAKLPSGYGRITGGGGSFYYVPLLNLLSQMAIQGAFSNSPGYVRSYRVRDGRPLREGTAYNRLPDWLETQSVVTALDTAQPRVDAQVLLPSTVAAGSVLDTPHYLLAQRPLPEGSLYPSPDGPAERSGRTFLVKDGQPALPADDQVKKLQGLCLMNPPETGAPINYMLNNETFALQPGEVHLVSADAYLVEFDMGGELGGTSYELEDGTFQFRFSKTKGWDLARKTYKVQRDNSANPNAFTYLINGKPATIAAGQNKDWSSKYPLLISYDPGDNGDPSRRWLTEGSYKIAVDSKATLLELYHVNRQGDSKATSG